MRKCQKVPKIPFRVNFSPIILLILFPSLEKLDNPYYHSVNNGGVGEGSCASGFGVCCYCKCTFFYHFHNYQGRRKLLK